MERELFSPMALDAMGELMNISLGSSATAVSNMLDHRVDITTPTVSVIASKDFVLGNLEPAIGVEIQYVEGLEGSNIMVLRRRDIKIIVDILMGTETPDEEFELNDLTISCVCEVMNQMMGASATAMSDFLGYPVNISTPTTFELDNLEDFKAKQGEDLVLARFFLRIEGKMESEFMNVMPVSLACKLLAGMGLEDEIFVKDGDEAAAPASAPEPAPAESSNKQLSQEEIEKMMAGMGGDSTPAPAPEPAPSGGKLSQEEIEKMMAGMG
ncbi:flagellar motor switch protein FliN, partial [Pseudoflavonifractor sp. 524-17]|uniref:chemotaxis protein CheC n=1 Tax=Pseudoflavonifractor sp. 524-17 TaxID=2304577 RepID=UPI00192A4DD0